MFGTREEFTYWECLECGCLQLSTIPDDMSRFYPEGYYSFTLDASRWKMWYYRTHLLAPHLMRLLRRCPPDLAAVIEARSKRGARILDVGSGSGRLVKILRALGFEAQGIDPFLENDGPYVRRASLDDVEGGWNLIMFHHSLEHMTDHRTVLQKARRKLAPGGACLVRIPVANWAWEHYGRDWVQLDAPRHVVIHTPRSFGLAAEVAGFRIAQTIYDSEGAQFFASELYKRDIPFVDQRVSTEFSPEELRSFTDRANQLNATKIGDQAAFLLVAK